MSETKEPKNAEFKYVDFWYTTADGSANTGWQRIEYKDIPKYQQDTASNFNCFATIQRFALKVKTKGEAYLSPLFFDLDYADNPALTLSEARRIVNFFTEELDLKESDIQVFFSGSKGFHIIVSSVALGIEPRADLHKIFKHIAGYLRYRLSETKTITTDTGEETTETLSMMSIDPVVYTSYRMIRLPNSIHQKTKLCKTELTTQELHLLSFDQIKGMADRKDTGPRILDKGKSSRALRPKASAFYKDKLKEYEQAAATSKDRFNNETYFFDKENPPACVQDILKGGWKKEGDRNNATVQLACYFKDSGHTKEETLTILEEWVTKHTSAKGNYSVSQRVANTRSVIDAVFSKENEYKFGCAFIRSLHGEKQPGTQDYDRVACAQELCPCLKQNNSPDEIPVPMHLAATGSAEFTGKLISTKIMIAGKKNTPFIVPKKIEYHCWGRSNCKKYSCPLYNIDNGTIYKTLTVKDRELIQMTGIGDDNIKGILREISTIPACQRFDVDIIETVNIEELLVIPMAEETENEAGEAEGKYVLRKVYSVGELSISENKYYEIEGYVFPHPKNQEGTIIIKKAKPLQDVVERFNLTEDIKEQLAIFQPKGFTAEAINEKLSAIMKDLTYNVTHIVERDEVLLGVLLVYHSVLRFKVPWDSYPIRGWVEFKIVGDTGTGKSALIEKLMKFTKLGSRANAESTSRTGLTYKMEQSGTGGSWYIMWGIWPLSDKELLWIDEDTGINKDEYGEMTMARSDGKLEVKRAVTAETPCRVRAILSGNVPGGKRLANYSQGVESLKDIFNNEDIRRFDFAVFMRKSDVPDEAYNQVLPTFPASIDSSTLKNNILFAWSRKPEDVIITHEAIDKILEASTDLSKVYGNATDVPLVSPSDQRNKLTRLAVSLAALTHSVDESGQRLMIYPGHVDYIAAYLKALYNAPGCALNYYAKLSIKEEELTDEKYNKLTKKIKCIDTVKQDAKFTEFINLFARQKYLRQGDIEAMLSIDKEEAKDLVNQLVKLRMVEMSTSGYRKTARFNAYVGKCFEKGLFDYIEDDI